MCVCIHFDVHVHFTLFLLLFLVPLSDCEELHLSAGEFAIILITLVMMGVVCRVTVEGVVSD